MNAAKLEPATTEYAIPADAVPDEPVTLEPTPEPELLPEVPQPADLLLWADEASGVGEAESGEQPTIIESFEHEEPVFEDFDGGLSIHVMSGLVKTNTGESATIDTGHVYEIHGGGFSALIGFQQGPVPQNGINGVTNEALLRVLIHRTRLINEKFPCDENLHAISYMEAALNCFNDRTDRRKKGGIEGQLVEDQIQPPPALTGQNLLTIGQATLAFLLSKKDSAMNAGCLSMPDHQAFGYVMSVSVGNERNKKPSVITVAKVWGDGLKRRADVVAYRVFDPSIGAKGLLDEVVCCREAYPTASLVVDDVGLGCSFGRALTEHNIAYKSVRWGAYCSNDDDRNTYFNKRSAAYVQLCQAIAESRFKVVDAMSDSDANVIVSQLCQIPYHFDDKGVGVENGN